MPLRVAAFAVMTDTRLRVDDIIIDRNGHCWFTSNKKVYEYADGKVLKTYTLGDKYIFRLHEDSLERIWATEWEGGQLRLEKGRFVQVTTEWPDSIDFSRVMTDRQGRLLVADGFGKCYALEKSFGLRRFQFNGNAHISKSVADSIRIKRHLSARPTAIATDGNGNLWFSTGKDIRRQTQGGEEEVICASVRSSQKDTPPTEYRRGWCLLCRAGGNTARQALESARRAQHGAFAAVGVVVAIISDEWLQQAIAQVEKNIADEHYNVEQLSSDLCMSRMTFYRKIQSATGQKPTEFIRTIRLHRAAVLLREGSMTATEVSYATGFSSVSYFSRCFRSLFGVPPTQFIS